MGHEVLLSSILIARMVSIKNIAGSLRRMIREGKPGHRRDFEMN